MNYNESFDVIIVGGGHAAVEAAIASSKLGVNTLMITQNINSIGEMSCNPSIGGIGKGQLVKEIDALGGVMAKAADEACIHFKTLNESKGPAVRSTRIQADRLLYKNAIIKFISQEKNLSIIQQNVENLLIKKNKVIGLITNLGIKFFSKIIVLTVGTFLNGCIHIGSIKKYGGRIGDQNSLNLSKNLEMIGFKTGRLKTGTPPRLDKRSVNLTNMSLQDSQEKNKKFSFFSSSIKNNKYMSCYITYTNFKTHDIVKSNINLSSTYNDDIVALGPRYCPSIEDKIIKFPDKNRHQIFIEPEGLNSFEFYPNGISNALPFDIQVKMVNSIEGLEQAKITRPGYAVEYDFFNPKFLFPYLETKLIENLFFAGQINGTTGYEEAAAQGLIAGINAALKVMEKPFWYPLRSEAYIGVLIDDLITQGTYEPYRMFTSRAEYRLTLREDNAILRLSDIAIKLGLLNNHDKNEFLKYQTSFLELIKLSKIKYIEKNSELAQKIEKNSNIKIEGKISVFNLLKKNKIHFNHIKIDDFSEKLMYQLEIQAKYEGYIIKQEQHIVKNKKLDKIKIPIKFNYQKIEGLSQEAKEKFIKFKPYTIGEASRISGITTCNVTALLIFLKKASIKNNV